MLGKRKAALGDPDLSFPGTDIWVHGYAYPGAQDPWDANWLRITTCVSAPGSRIWTEGTILDAVSFDHFVTQLRSLYESLRGEAILESHEPNLTVRVRGEGSLGHLNIRVEITPDHLTQGHWFEFESDQTSLKAMIGQCMAILGHYPVRYGRELQ